MTAPIFDAHGWCHDMDAAPRGEPVLGWIWDAPEHKAHVVICFETYWEIVSDPSAPRNAVAWRPLPAGPKDCD